MNQAVGNTPNQIETTVKVLVDAQLAEMHDQMAQMNEAMVNLSNMMSRQLNIQPCQPANVQSTVPPLEALDTNRRFMSPGMSSIMSSRERYEARIRVDRWGLQFDGDSSRLAVEVFIFRLEHMQSRYGLPWDEILRDFHLLLSGAAKNWFWLHIKTNADLNWISLRKALLQQYQSARSDMEIMRDLVERKQLPGETIDAYFHAMSDMRARLTQNVPEDQMVRMIKANMKESISKYVWSMPVSTVNDLRIECREAEKTFGRRERPTVPIQNRFTRQVNEIEVSIIESEAESEEEIAALQVQKAPMRKKLTCWNCGKEDEHTWWDCPLTELKVFCFRCGKPDVKRISCPNCQGNPPRSLGYRANQSSDP